MLGVLFGQAPIPGAADPLATWLCLSGELGEATVAERNPLAAWLFEGLPTLGAAPVGSA